MNNGKYLSILDEIKKHGGETNTSNPNEKVLIIDGLNTFIRVFSVIPTTNEDGIHIGGIVGFLKSVGYAVKMLAPTRTIITFVLMVEVGVIAAVNFILNIKRNEEQKESDLIV